MPPWRCGGLGHASEMSLEGQLVESANVAPRHRLRRDARHLHCGDRGWMRRYKNCHEDCDWFWRGDDRARSATRDGLLRAHQVADPQRKPLRTRVRSRLASVRSDGGARGRPRQSASTGSSGSERQLHSRGRSPATYLRGFSERARHRPKQRAQSDDNPGFGVRAGNRGQEPAPPLTFRPLGIASRRLLWIRSATSTQNPGHLSRPAVPPIG